MLSCVILNYNDSETTISLCQKVKRIRSIEHYVIVDNCSNDNSFERMQCLIDNKTVVVRTNHNGGYGYGNNYGVRYAYDNLKCEYALIVNPDVDFDENTVEGLLETLRSMPDCAIVSAMQHDRCDRPIKESAWKIPTVKQYVFSQGAITRKFVRSFYYTSQELTTKRVRVDCVSGSLMMAACPKFLSCGGFDEKVFLYCEETILGYRLKEAGFITVLCTDLHYLHLHGVSIQKSVKSRIRRKKLYLQSHRYFLKVYLKIGGFVAFIDRIFGGIALCEEWIKTVLGK